LGAQLVAYPIRLCCVLRLIGLRYLAWYAVRCDFELRQKRNRLGYAGIGVTTDENRKTNICRCSRISAVSPNAQRATCSEIALVGGLIKLPYTRGPVAIRAGSNKPKLAVVMLQPSQ
jgi:hypothetical protein